MEKLTAPALLKSHAKQRPPHPRRSSVARLSILRRIAIASVLLGAIGETSQTKSPHPEHSSPIVHARSLEDILYTVRSAIGDIVMEERRAPPDDPDLSPDPGIAAFTMAKAALSKVWSTCGRLWEEPSETAREISDNVCSSARYLRDYRLSEEQASRSDPKTLDCNDHANITCERLDRLGLPIYLLSIWPEDPTLRFDSDKGWHEMSVCKLRHECFLIFDENRTTLWHGSLASFALRYGPNVRMRIIPHVGISRYAEPKYDHCVAKLLVQAVKGVENENEMESLGLQPPGEVMQIARR